MRRGHKYVASFFLSAAMMAPIGAFALAPQDDHERHEREERERRSYDRDYRDYHRWDEHEQKMYREYLRERNFAYIDFDQLTPQDQHDYWRWRHEKREERMEREHR